MNINRVCIVLIVLVASIGIISANSSNNAVYGADKWVKFNQSNVGMINLKATVHVTIKNNENHVEYFKISNVYTGANSADDTTIQWIVDDTDPSASKMIDAVNPQLGGDWGWKIQPGQTKTVSFSMHAVGVMGVIPTYESNANAVENTYWPIIPDPGLFSSWFQPNEIETLNPNLDLKYWKGRFSFDLIGSPTLDHSVSGIIRAPIVPLDSKLTSSSPQATFKDRNLIMNGAIAAWDVTVHPDDDPQHFIYTYVWAPGSSSSSTGTYSYVPKTSAASTTSPVSTKQTGIPYIPFVVGGILVAGGLAYAGFRR
jgi:hypothetical protein